MLADTLMTAPGTPPAADSAPAPASETPTGTPPADGSTPATPAPAAPATPESGSTPAATGTDGDTPAGDKPADKAADQVPESYELTLPEGSPLDQSALEKTASWARERGLSNEQAQAALEYANDQAQARDAHLRAEVERLAYEEWPTQLQADPEYGGEKFDQTAEHARRALAKFGTPALSQALKDTGYGNHPELVKTFARIGKELADDRLEGGGQGGTGSRSLADRLFG